MRSQASSEGRRTLTLLGCRARRRLRHDGRVATAVLGRADAHVQPALGLVVTADAGCLSNRFCSVLLCPCMGSIRFRSVSSPAAVLRGRRPRARWARSAASLSCSVRSGRSSFTHVFNCTSLSLNCTYLAYWELSQLYVLSLNCTNVLAPADGLGPRSRSLCTVFGFCYLLVWGYIADLSMVPRLRRGRLAGRALSHPLSCAVKIVFVLSQPSMY